MLPGDGLPLILRGGRAVASWSHNFAGNRLRVTVAPFEAGALPAGFDESAFAAIGRLLGASAIELAVAAG